MSAAGKSKIEVVRLESGSDEKILFDFLFTAEVFVKTSFFYIFLLLFFTREHILCSSAAVPQW